jgi:23S rRNA pseudouridine1911/1915/1917 synthase
MGIVVVFENDDLVVIDKPQGLAVTPGAGASLCAGLFAERPDLAAVPGFKPGEGGLLNRLDNDTGGLVLFAKHEIAFRRFALAMRAGRVKKTYLAVVHGRPSADAGVIDLAIGHSPMSARRMLVAAPGRPIRGRPQPARTAFRILENAWGFFASGSVH